MWRNFKIKRAFVAKLKKTQNLGSLIEKKNQLTPRDKQEIQNIQGIKDKYTLTDKDYETYLKLAKQVYSKIMKQTYGSSYSGN